MNHKRELLGPSDISVVFFFSFFRVCRVSSSCCWTENRAFSLSAFSFLEPGFVKGVERTVLTEAPADRRVFFRHLCACAGLGQGGRGRSISVSNELQRSVVIQWHLCKQKFHPKYEYQ